MVEMARPEGYGRRPADGPEVTRAQLDRRQAQRLNQTENGTIVDGEKQGFVTPEESAK